MIGQTGPKLQNYLKTGKAYGIQVLQPFEYQTPQLSCIQMNPVFRQLL